MHALFIYLLSVFVYFLSILHQFPTKEKKLLSSGLTITDGLKTFVIGAFRGNFGGVTVFLPGMLYIRVISRKILE